MEGVADANLPRLLSSVQRSMTTDLVTELEERGWPELRSSHATLLMNVDRRTGSRLSDLGRRLGVTKQAVMIVVDDLEARGLVRRTPDPEDGRAKMVRLTARGRTCAAECRRALASVEARAGGGRGGGGGGGPGARGAPRPRRILGGRRHDALRESLEILLEQEEEA
jgi:DNA-binding MarR family transcriptional regulator